MSRMKLGTIIAVTITSLSLFVTAAFAQQNPREIFERARMLDESNQNLSEAIKLYSQVVNQSNEQRALAAKAQYRIGVLYERLGRKADAQRAYQTVVKQYGDQSEVAGRARAKLPAAAKANVNGRKKSVPTENGPNSTLVWQGEKIDQMAASASADGRYISFTDWSTGDLLLHDLNTDENHVLVSANNSKPGKVENFVEASAISRDGAKVAYSWFDAKKDRYELWVVNLRGDTKPRRLYEEPEVTWLEPSDWSPDGRWIAVNVSNSKTGLDQLGVISVDDGNARFLKGGHWPGNSTRIFFSPDGKYLAYDLPQDASGSRDVWVTALDGTTDSAVVAYRGNDVIMGWSPDGKHLLFATDRMGSMALYSVGIRNGTLQGVPALLKPDMGLTQSMGVTTAGALFYGTQRGRRGGSIKVAQFDIRSGGLISARDVSSNPQENNMNPTWSPDGKYLAYLSERGRAGATAVIVVRTASTGGLVREIEPKIQGIILAGWQPDSKWLLVTGNDFNGRYGAFGVDVETGEVSFLLATPWADALHMPAWSADGHILYYWNRVNSGDEHVFVAHDTASGTEKEIVRKPFLGALILSPDGRFLATETVDLAKNDRVLLLVRIDGAVCRELMRVPAGVPPKDVKLAQSKGAQIYPAAWAPDSQSFIARLQREPDGESELWQVPVDGTVPRKLPSMLEADVFKFTISPDGRRVAYRFKEPEAAVPQQVWKFEHFIPANSRQTIPGTKSSHRTSPR